MAIKYFNYERPEVYEKQRLFIDDPNRHVTVEASTKSGKTTGCIIWIFEEAIQGKKGANCWWVAPTKAVAKIAYERLKRFLNNDRRLFRQNQTELRITLPNEVSIWFKSGDNPDSLYGEDVIAVVIDEATRMKKESWYAIRSTLTATNGRSRIIGNVKGRGNWVYKLARQAEKGVLNNWGYHKITVDDAIYGGVFSQEEFEQAKEDLPEEVIKELYYADALDDRGLPFIWGFNEQKNICDSWDIRDDIPVHASFDFNVDPMTCTLHQHDPYNFDWIRTFDEIKLNNSDIYEMCREIKEVRYPEIVENIIINGDASGHNRHGALKKNQNYFTIIRSELNCSKSQIKVIKGSNPLHENSRLLTNTLFRKHPDCKITHNCKHLIDDLKFVQSKEGKIDKDDCEDKNIGHFLDTERYYHWQNFKKYIKKYLPSSNDDNDEEINEAA